MNTKEILSITTLGVLGICLIIYGIKMTTKTGSKSMKGLDTFFTVFTFGAVVLLAVGQMLDSSSTKCTPTKCKPSPCTPTKCKPSPCIPTGIFAKPMVGYWYYPFPSTGSGSGESDITPPQLNAMSQTLGLNTDINTYFNLASGAIPNKYGKTTPQFGIGTLECTPRNGGPGILQPYPPHAPKQLKYKVLNIGGWGSHAPDKPTLWRIESLTEIFSNIAGVISYMKSVKNNYNVLSLDIEGLVDDDQFATMINNISGAIKTAELGMMLTLPGYGVQFGGNDWLTAVNADNIDKLCLMYYDKINDTESKSYNSASMQKNMATNIQKYPAYKKILGLSCATPDCMINGKSLLTDPWIQQNFQGGISMWRKYLSSTSGGPGVAGNSDAATPADEATCPPGFTQVY